MQINGSSGRSYEVGRLVAETPRWRLYLCQLVGTPGDLLLQVSTGAEHNAALERSAYLFGRLKEEAVRAEEEYAKVKKDPKHFLNYHLSFPALVDGFIFEKQGRRRVNILKLEGIDNLANATPLALLVHKDRLRVDLRTSVWIMGKLLKILAFVHSVGIKVGDLSLGNILVEPAQHYVVIFSWADAELGNEAVERAVVRQEIKQTAERVIEVLGGSLDETVATDSTSPSDAYIARLIELARDGASNALRAHQEFYQLVDGIWPRKYHPFTTMPRAEREEGN